MRLYYEAPRAYIFNVPMFDGKNITERVRTGFENVLSAYVDIANVRAPKLDDNSENYRISDVLLVGSGARLNKVDSDMDFLLIAPQLDERSSKEVTLLLNAVFFADRPKASAIDPYVRNVDLFPERDSVLITNQVVQLLDRYQSKLDGS